MHLLWEKTGWVNGNHFDGALCDTCYSLCSGFKMGALAEKKTAEEYLEFYREIAENIDNQEFGLEKREQIKKMFFNQINEKYISMKGIGFKEEIKQRENSIQKEQQHREYANSFNEFYEYDVVTIINKNHGTVDKEKMMNILSEHARNGWKLHTMYSNELGKNALSILGLGTNSTACEDVMIFERRIMKFE